MMDYRQIIKNNCDLHSSVSWWPKFAFHYTDVKNAVSILSCGCLYSRINAEKLGLMRNDNASRQVIDMTNTQATAHVRFYFRPLTPTQYHNEGYKHPALRYDGDSKANMPVPIFFVFDLETMLSLPGVCFSERAQSGFGAPLFHRIEDFAKFDFDRIYSCGFGENWKETQKYRHAELLYPGRFDINTCLKSILCRNAVEQATLLALLKQASPEQYYRYKPIIKICRESMFEYNGLFIESCQYHARTISISFSNTYCKTQHCRREMSKRGLTALPPVRARLELSWLNSRRLFHKASADFQIDYLQPRPIAFTNLPYIPNAKTLQVQIYFEEDLMCFLEQPLADSELIK